MKLSFDPVKNERNVQERGLAFTLVAELDWTTALIDENIRENYGERRFRAPARPVRWVMACKAMRGYITWLEAQCRVGAARQVGRPAVRGDGQQESERS